MILNYVRLLQENVNHFFKHLQDLLQRFWNLLILIQEPETGSSSVAFQWLSSSPVARGTNPPCHPKYERSNTRCVIFAHHRWTPNWDVSGRSHLGIRTSTGSSVCYLTDIRTPCPARTWHPLFSQTASGRCWTASGRSVSTPRPEWICFPIRLCPTVVGSPGGQSNPAERTSCRPENRTQHNQQAVSRCSWFGVETLTFNFSMKCDKIMADIW